VAGLATCLLACIAGLVACRPAPRAAAPPAAPDVVVRTLQAQSVTLRSELPGRTAAYAIAEIRPQVSGIVRRRRFNEGATVAAGQVLYEIDPAPFASAAEQQAANLADAEAAAKLAELQEKRYRTLVPQGTVSQQDYDTAAATLAQAQARVRLARAAANSARISLQWTQITSPIAGRTGRSLVTPGALVSANQADALTTVSQLDPIYVDLTQSSAELLRLRQARSSGRMDAGADSTRKVRLKLDDGAAYPHEGRLQLAEVTVDPSTGSVALRAVFPNPDGLLLPGMYVRAELDEGVDSRGILLPQEAINRDRKGNATVRLVEDGKLSVKAVSVSRAIGNDWLVDSGLSPGDRVVIEGASNARPGSEVHVIEAP
jgi:membrane fusion protein (multidrug efflux system)